MTCASCEEHVNYAASQLNGVTHSEASFEEGKAVIQYDNSKVIQDEIIEAVNNTGYQVIHVELTQVE